MASQSLYRKWRSQTFSDLVGQETIVDTLKNALNSGKLAHAYLFTGPRGTGKTSTARLLAKTINCLDPQNGEPCNVCEQCREITAGSSFNVIEIDAASNRGIDSIRELREKVMMPPATGKYKVYILDEAHMLTTEAFNALLKTLEEPPPHAIFVMATTDVHKMLPTVLSRCQRFDFKRFTLSQLVERLNYVAAEEQVHLEHGAAELLARAAAGGMRDALSLLDQAIAYCGSVISLAQVQAMLGVADPRAIQKLVLNIAQLESPEGLHLIHELSEAGADLRQINTQLAEYFRAMMLARAGANISEILDATKEEVAEIQQVSRLFALEELTACARTFAQNELMQKNLGTPQLGLELALLACIEVHHRGGEASVTSRADLPASGQPASRSFETPVREAPVRQPAVAAQPSTQPQPSMRPPETRVASTQPPQVLAASAPQPAPPVLHQATSLPADLVEKATENAQATRADMGVAKDADLPDWDTLSYVEEAEEIEGEATSPETPVRATAPARPVEPEQLATPSVASQPSVPAPASIAQPEPQPVAAQESADQPTLTVQDVKEKWEYIKRRVRSRSMKDGPLIQALLNDYTVLSIEGTRDIPIVVLRAGADFHFKQLQNNEERRKVLEWALKVELQQECRAKLVPPGHLGSSMVLPPPVPGGPPGSSLISSMLAMPRSSAFQERSVAEKPPSAMIAPVPAPRSEVQTRPAATVSPVQEKPVERPAPPRSEISPPLARMQSVRENTISGEKIRPEEHSANRQARIEQQVKADPVVQELVRLFKADIKEIRPK